MRKFLSSLSDKALTRLMTATALIAVVVVYLALAYFGEPRSAWLVCNILKVKVC